MADELWGVGSDARRAARPVVLCGALGVAAFAITFSGALVLGRGLAGSALAALLLPLALSGALAVGLAVAFVVAVAVEQPYGTRRVSRLVTVVAPLAALVALFAYASDPTAQLGRPLARESAPFSDDGTPAAPGRRSVSVPRAQPVPPAPPGQPPADPPPAVPGSAPAPAGPAPEAAGPTVAPPPAAGPAVAGPVVPKARVAAPETPGPREVGPRRVKRLQASITGAPERATQSLGKQRPKKQKRCPAKAAKAKQGRASCRRR